MRKTGGVEIETETVLLRPGNPVRKMPWLDLVAIHFLATKFAVECVQIQAMLARDERECLVDVGTEFVWRAGFAGMIARDGESVAECAANIFKAANVIALPALQRDGNSRKKF